MLTIEVVKAGRQCNPIFNERDGFSYQNRGMTPAFAKDPSGKNGLLTTVRVAECKTDQIAPRGFTSILSDLPIRLPFEPCLMASNKVEANRQGLLRSRDLPDRVRCFL